MCILLKLDYAKFDVSRLFCSKVIEEKPLRGRLDSLGKGRVNNNTTVRAIAHLKHRHTQTQTQTHTYTKQYPISISHTSQP